MQDETGAVETRIMDAIAAATDLSALEDVRVAALGIGQFRLEPNFDTVTETRKCSLADAVTFNLLIYGSYNYVLISVSVAGKQNRQDLRRRLSRDESHSS